MLWVTHIKYARLNIATTNYDAIEVNQRLGCFHCLQDAKYFGFLFVFIFYVFIFLLQVTKNEEVIEVDTSFKKNRMFGCQSESTDQIFLKKQFSKQHYKK